MRHRSYGSTRSITALAVVAICFACGYAPGQSPMPRPPAPVQAPEIQPTYSVDLMTATGMSAFAAQWRYQDASIIETPALPNAGQQWKKTYDLTPKAAEINFDDSAWPVIDPSSLKQMRCGGKICFAWYRTRLTIPAKIGDLDPTGMKVALVITVDDYAEVSVNGQIPRSFGRPSPATIQGFNMPNRVLLTESAKPGERFEIAILGINGPISIAPENFVFFRQASVEFFKLPY